MARDVLKDDLIPLGLLAVGLGIVFWAATTEDKRESNRAPEPTPRRPAPAPPGDDPRALARDDETALARMLASETGDPNARVVVGWIALQFARRRKVSLFKLLTADSGEYGPQKLAGVIRYAATTKSPTAETRKLAQELLAGELQPSEAIRAHGLSPWVEWLPARLSSDEKKGLGPEAQQVLLAQREDQNAVNVLKFQKPLPGNKGNFGGIWGRIAGTRWFLFDRRAPIIEYESRKGGPARALSSVPKVEALDAKSRRPAVA